MNTDQATQPLEDAPKKLTLKGIPVDPNLRILGVATLVNTFGNGALMTTSALYFNLVVGLQPTQLALAVSAGAGGLGWRWRSRLALSPVCWSRSLPDTSQIFEAPDGCCRRSLLAPVSRCWGCCSLVPYGRWWP